MAKISEKPVKRSTRKANELAVENEVKVEIEVKEKTNLEKAIESLDKLIQGNLSASGRNYLNKDEVICILNSYIKD